MPFHYVKDPATIYRDSFATIRAESELGAFPADIEPVAVRMIHTAGDPSIAASVAFSPGVVKAARAALEAGAPILCDAKMIAAGVTRARLPAGNEVTCFLDREGLAEHARTIGNTRSAAAIDLWGDRLAGAVVAIGNAPTALFYLLEKLMQGAPRPAAIIGMPVGFIGAAESKEALIDHAGEVPFLTLRGRRGGSAVTVAALNAIASRIE